ncbi:hypothetical protein RHGRI_023294 [Rhododendron griersonianum]|uniref:Uncharacterized protein n=1 Tax=Rhododendron griersonianum TaxID=479676 RepID=A0AAV6J9Z7_9ERIC|nr:hypothetical protein RHGRI_023294 [Rhododendron griersonianum]
MPRGEGEGSGEPTMTYMYDAKDMWDRQACPKQPRTPFGEEGGCVGRIGVVSGRAIFGPPLDEYWKKKVQEEAVTKENDRSST